MRAVLDSNVLISAVISRGGAGAPAQLLARWRRGDFELVTSQRVLTELVQVLDYPKLRARVSRRDADGLVTLLRERAAVCPDPGSVPRRAPDPEDDYLLALAEAERAILVSGDQHLLGLAPEYPILTPRAFLETLETQR